MSPKLFSVMSSMSTSISLKPVTLLAKRNYAVFSFKFVIPALGFARA
jgi:hypothetical protein